MYRSPPWGSPGVFADVPDRLDADKVELAIIILLVVGGIGMVAILRTVQKATTRLVLLGLIFILGIGLWLQREELQQCEDRSQCTCRIFGLDVKMPETFNNSCPD
jgi:hypothetical protein